MRWYLLVFALIVAGCGEGGKPAAVNRAAEALIGRSLLNLQVKNLDNGAETMRDVLPDGKPVVLNVWATWCPPCLKEMPTLDALGKQGEFTVIAIATDKDTETVKAFLKKQEWGSGVRVWFDSLGAVTRKELGATGIPVTYVLDPSLTVRLVEAGERDWAHPKMVAKMKKAISDTR